MEVGHHGGAEAAYWRRSCILRLFFGILILAASHLSVEGCHRSAYPCNHSSPLWARVVLPPRGPGAQRRLACPLRPRARGPGRPPATPLALGPGSRGAEMPQRRGVAPSATQEAVRHSFPLGSGSAVPRGCSGGVRGPGRPPATPLHSIGFTLSKCGAYPASVWVLFACGWCPS